MSRRRRSIGNVATVGFVVAALALLAVEWAPAASGMTPVKGKSKIATCVVPGSAGQSTKWFAHYQVTERGKKPEIRLVSTGEQSSVPALSAGALRPWVLSWTSPHRKPATARKRGPDIGSATFSTEKVQLLSPDGQCILYLSAIPTPRHRVAVIGDSVFANIAQTVVKNALGSQSYAQSWQISATSGNGWNATPVTWPLKVVGGELGNRFGPGPRGEPPVGSRGRTRR